MIVGETEEFILTITNEGNWNLSIYEFALEGDPFGAIYDDEDVHVVQPNDDFELPVSFSPDDLGQFQGTLTIVSDDPDEPEIEIPLSGTGTSPDIDVVPDELAFGEIDTAQSVDLQLVIRNLGDAVMTVSDMTIEGDDVFSIDFDGEFTIDHASQVVMTATFTTDEVGDYEATLTIFSNDFDEPEVEIAMSGSAVIPDNVHDVPDDFDTIQDAIDAAEEGDTVLVHPGVYNENVNFRDRNLTLASLFLTTGDDAYIDSTVIDGGGNGITVNIRNGQSEETVVSGLTIRNGAANYGAGIYINGTTPTLDHLVVTSNTAARFGGGIYATHDAHPTLSHITISGNTGEIGNGGIHIYDNSSAVFVNSILYGNAPPALPGGLTVTYSDVEGGIGGAGNIEGGTLNYQGVPEFAAPGKGDYHIGPLSAALDTGVDAGIATDGDGESRPYGDGYDLGADEYWPLQVFLPMTLRGF